MSNFSNNVDLIYTAKFIILITEQAQNWVAFNHGTPSPLTLKCP